MTSKFDQLCNLVIESAEQSIREASNPVTYGLNPEFDSSGLTGFDKLAASFVEEKPATADEIVDIIQRNSEDPDNRNAAVDTFKNLIDSKILIPAEATVGDEDAVGEPDAAALAAAEKEQPDDTAVTAPAAIQPPVEDEEEVDDASAVPPPEEDEGDTFVPAPKSRIEDTAPTGDEDEVEDDIPASVLVKQEQEKAARKKAQLAKLVQHMFQRRGKSPEQAAAYMQHAAQKGLI